MVGEAFGVRGKPWIVRLRIAACPTARTIALANRRIHIFAERSRERALVSRLGRQTRDRRAAAVFEGSGKRVMF
jgi:hypothetical protein